MTSFTYRLHAVGPLWAGLVAHPIDAMPEMLRVYRDFVSTAPDALTVHAGAMTLPDVGPVAVMLPVWCGEAAEGERHLAPLRAYGRPLFDTVMLEPKTKSATVCDWLTVTMVMPPRMPIVLEGVTITMGLLLLMRPPVLLRTSSTRLGMFSLRSVLKLCLKNLRRCFGEKVLSSITANFLLLSTLKLPYEGGLLAAVRLARLSGRRGNESGFGG